MRGESPQNPEAQYAERLKQLLAQRETLKAVVAYLNGEGV